MDEANQRSPGDYIKEALSARGWTQADLARVLDRPLPTVNRILNGKHQILPDMAIALAAALGEDAEEWMAREAAYRLALAGTAGGADVQRRAGLYEIAPVKEMEKRGWIRGANDTDSLESELCRFFSTESLDCIPSLSGATRRTGDAMQLTPTQRAWCFRVRQLASAKITTSYSEHRLDACMKELRKIAAYPQEIHKIPAALAKYGIRLVIVEPLSGCKVDGFATWLADDQPVIGLSLRFDRIDGFWFTLCHELSHIRHRDDVGVDSDLSESISLPTEVKPEQERRADAEAASSLIKVDELESFINRVGPLYSRERIVRFAHRIRIHPGIIVGQLQHRGEVGYHAHRGFLCKVRDIIAPTALTDGWGHSVELGDA